jgi:DNA-binding response OmpR family regulator
MQSFGDDGVKTGRRVVLAEHDTDLRIQYGESLRQSGYVVWEAADGGAALHLVRSHAPQLLLIGLWMPVLNGLEVIEQLAGIPESAGVKVAVLAPRHDSDLELEGAALGVDGYWTTDLSANELCKRVDELMGPARIPPG